MNSADGMLVEFKSHVRPKVVPAEAVYLVSGNELVTALSGPSIERLAPLLDGSRTVGQVIREMSPHLTADGVRRMLRRLHQADLVRFVAPRSAGQPRDAALGYWDLAGLDALAAVTAVARAAVRIVAVGGADAEPVAAAVRESGLVMAGQASQPGEFTIVVCGDYLDPELAAVNAEHLRTSEPWLLAMPDGPHPWIGPVFQPGSGPCWACLAKRLEGNRPGEFLVRRVLGMSNDRRDHEPAPSLQAGRAMAVQMAVLESLKWLAGWRYPGQRDVFVMNTLTMDGTHHAVASRPQCRACGDPGLVAARTAQPVAPMPRQAVAEDGNGLRALRLHEVLERYDHLVDPVTGIVAELRRDPRCPESIQSYLSGRNRAMTQTSIAGLRAGLRAHSGGKGATELEAKVGALCEAVERYCGTLDGDELRIRDSYRNLGLQAVHPDTCQLFAEQQFACRARWNAGSAPHHRVPEPFDDTVAIDWTPVWSLLTREQKLLPTTLLYFKPDGADESAFCHADSNGNAAGTTLEDAILQGFLELVERDAVGIWWYNKTRRPMVCLDSFQDAWVARLPEVYRRLSRQFWVLDVTSDLGIPAMVAVSRRTDKAAEDIMLGFGAHLDPRIALRRALTELGQLLPAVAGAGADGSGYAAAEPYLMSWWTTATTVNQPYLLPDQEAIPRTAASYGDPSGQGIDLAPVCAAARDAGLNIFVLDQTRPDINMPVVKVVVPGLRHFWPRFAPGRLFDIPVRLGQLPEPTAYENLNPIPLYQ